MIQQHGVKKASFFIAVLPLIFLVALLSFNVHLYGDNSLSGANQMALLLAAAFAMVTGLSLGYNYKNIIEGVVSSIKTALSAILILMMIGALAGTWMVSGVVPTMIYYGLELLSPSYFLVAAVIVSSIVSLATGSSWSTVATVGVALLGIGSAMEIDKGMIAGAIISGAYFGDKMSPLSDTTNLAPAMAGSDLFTHVKYMIYTTVPTLIITLIIFLILGFTSNAHQSGEGVEAMLKAIDGKFYISPVLFIVPLIVIGMIVMKIDALPALFIGALIGGIAAVIYQPHIIKEIAGGGVGYFEQSYRAVINVLTGSVSLKTGNTEVNGLLETKGMFGMMNTIWLILCAMTFGGVMEACGFLGVISRKIVSIAHSTGSLIATTAATCVVFNATASDQYLAIVVPGKMFSKTFRERGLKPENLSRTLEDSGTVTSVLFPWNTCGATQASVLGVATGTYWMYCFFNLLSPLMTVLYAYLNIKIRRYSPEEMEQINAEHQAV